MKKISILFSLFFAFFLICASAVQAEKFDWADDAYPFKSIRTALIYDIDLTDAEIESPIIQRVMETDYLNYAKKPPPIRCLDRTRLKKKWPPSIRPA